MAGGRADLADPAHDRPLGRDNDARRSGLDVWGYFARRPRLYRAATRLGMGALALLGKGRGAFRSLPFAGGWTKGRDLPVPQGGGTFMAQYRRRQRARG